MHGRTAVTGLILNHEDDVMDSQSVDRKALADSDTGS
jgi:hypothetical protein